MNKKELQALVGRWQLQMRKGLLTYLVLAHLKHDEYYGYALITALSKHLGNEMAEGTIYPLLNRMKREGLIDFRWELMETGPARKYYTITKDGEKALDIMHSHWDDLNAGIRKLKK